MLLTTVGALLTLARQRASMENSTFCTDAEVVSYLNVGFQEAYAEIADAYGEDFVASGSFGPGDGATDTWALPMNLMRLTGVDATYNGDTISLRSFNFRERNIYKNASYVQGFARPMYRLQGQNIHLIPVPPAGTTMMLWYIPAPITLSSANLAATVDDIYGAAEFACWNAVATMLAKEESDPGYALEKREAARARIRAGAPQRDAGDAPRVTDIMSGRTLDGNFGSGWGGGWE